MNKLTTTIAIIVLIVLVGGGIYLSRRDGSPETTTNPVATSSSSTTNADNSDSAVVPVTTSSPASESATTTSVSIENYAFSPATITIKKGTKVTWTNKDSVKHNVMDANDKTNGPSGPLLAKGESYSFTFNKVGTFKYMCEPNPYMQGTVEVTE